MLNVDRNNKTDVGLGAPEHTLDQQKNKTCAKVPIRATCDK